MKLNLRFVIYFYIIKIIDDFNFNNILREVFINNNLGPNLKKIYIQT
jgi:hypothetical protein